MTFLDTVEKYKSKGADARRYTMLELKNNLLSAAMAGKEGTEKSSFFDWLRPYVPPALMPSQSPTLMKQAIREYAHDDNESPEVFLKNIMNILKKIAHDRTDKPNQVVGLLDTSFFNTALGGSGLSISGNIVHACLQFYIFSKLTDAQLDYIDNYVLAASMQDLQLDATQHPLKTRSSLLFEQFIGLYQQHLNDKDEEVFFNEFNAYVDDFIKYRSNDNLLAMSNRYDDVARQQDGTKNAVVTLSVHVANSLFRPVIEQASDDKLNSGPSNSPKP